MFKFIGTYKLKTMELWNPETSYSLLSKYPSFNNCFKYIRLHVQIQYDECTNVVRIRYTIPYLKTISSDCFQYNKTINCFTDMDGLNVFICSSGYLHIEKKSQDVDIDDVYHVYDNELKLNRKIFRNQLHIGEETFYFKRI
jgi:hypothetical protein